MFYLSRIRPFASFAVAAVFVLLQAPTADAATLDEIRLSWQRDSATTMTVMWRTDAAITPIVQYGPTTQYGSETTGTSQPAVLDGYTYHTVEIVGLTPNTAYHYRVSGPGSVWSNDAIFRTAPNGATDFTFTVFADNGMVGNNGSRAVTMKDRVAAQQPALHLIAGDLSYADGDWCDGRPCMREHWEGWLQEMERIARTIPVMPAIGNHEVKDDMRLPDGELFFTRSFALPGGNGERVYSFDYGDAHFVALDTNDWRGLRRGGVQYNWLESDLAATTKRWKVVYFHHLAYTSGGRHSDLESLQQETTPLFDRYGVDLVIQAHNHHYERTYPLRYRAPNDPTIVSTDRSAYANPAAPVYVTTGGGGAGIYSFPSTPKPWSAARCECHEFLRVDVDDAGILTVAAIGLDGSTVDRFTIAKTADGAAPPPSTTSTSSTSSTSSQPPTSTTPPTTTLTAPTTPPLAPLSTAQTIRGFNMGGWSRDALGGSGTRQSLDRLAATGANEVAIAPFWYQDRKDSVQIYRRDSKTPTDDSVRAVIRHAKSKGLRAALKPMVDSRDGTWRGRLEPSDVAAWFQSYEQFLLTYARMAAEEQVDRLIIGTELATMTRPAHTAAWRSLIAKVREVYRGPLTYAANWGERNEGEYYQVEFWDALDAIGIDAYFPLSAADRPTVAEVEAAWRVTTKGGREVRWVDDIWQLHERFQKSVILTEIGYLSCERAGEKPWEYPCRHAVAPEVQANLYEGTLRVWSAVDWMLGYHFWRWDTNPDAGGPTNGDYMPQGKLAEEVLRRYWTSAAPAPASTATSTTTSAPAVGNAPAPSQNAAATTPSSTTSSTSPSASQPTNTGSGSASSSGGGSPASPPASSGGGSPPPAAPSSSGGGGGGTPGSGTPQWAHGPTALNVPEPRALLKLACPVGAGIDHPCRTVYWYGSDGQRYAFPNEVVYRTWYTDFSSVRVVLPEQLAALPLGGLVTHRPGVRLVKLPYSPKVYAVDRGATLRWLTTEAVAAAVAGPTWNRAIDDLPEWLFERCRIGAPITAPAEFKPTEIRTIDMDTELRDITIAKQRRFASR